MISRFSIILLCLLFQSLLAGCTEFSEPHPTIPPSTTNSLTPITTQPVDHSIKTSLVKYADGLSECRWDNSIIEDISPDAAWVIVRCNYEGVPGLYIWKIGEKTATRLFKSDEIEGAYSFFSPDSKKLLVALLNGPLWLYKVGQWDNPQMLYPKLPRYAVPTWNPDSQSFAISYIDDHWALSIMRLDGSFFHLIPMNEVHADDVYYELNMFGPAWSPDGSKIAYVLAKDIGNPQPIQLWTVEIDNEKRELLYKGKSGEVGYEPLWSPNGKYILLKNNEQNNQQNLFIYRLEDNSLKAILNPADPWPNIIWSPDGNSFSVNNYIYNVSTGKLIQIGYRPILWKTNQSVLLYLIDDNFYLLGWE